MPAVTRPASEPSTGSQVIAAAHRLLDRDGPTALSVRRLAAEAGVAPMTIYNTFSSKDGVVDRVVQDGFEELRVRLTAAGRHRSIAARLRAGGAIYRRLAAERPQLYSVMFERAIPDYEPSGDCLERAGSSFGVLVGHIAEGQASGEIVAGDPLEIAQRLWALLHGLVTLELHDIGFVTDRDRHFALALDTMISGLLRMPKQTAPDAPKRPR